MSFINVESEGVHIELGKTPGSELVSVTRSILGYALAGPDKRIPGVWTLTEKGGGPTVADFTPVDPTDVEKLKNIGSGLNVLPGVSSRPIETQTSAQDLSEVPETSGIQPSVHYAPENTVAQSGDVLRVSPIAPFTLNQF
jgi:hypothetical protein